MANEGIELAIYKPSNLNTPYAILPGRRNPKALEEIGGVGGGSFFVSYNDPKTQDAEVLKSRNICKVKVDGQVVNAFILTDREATVIGSGENKDRGRTLSGNGLKGFFDDASVAPYRGVRQNSKDTRYFNFATEQGSWYVASDWINPIIYGTVNVDPRWGDRVKKWPEKAKNAKWIWAAPYASPAPDTPCYFRWTVNIATAGLFAIYVTADDYFELYVDGEQIAKSNLNTSASNEAARIEVPLSAGSHIIGFKARNVIAPGFNGPAALAAALFAIADDKTETFLGQSGDGGWKALPYPAQEPGWTAGEVLIKLLDEAQTRGVLFPGYFTKTFTATQDSKGAAWADKLAWTFKVGESYSSVLKKLEDLYEVWIDPSDFTLNMAPTRGTNRSGGTSPVQLVVGRDLLEANTKAQGRIKNALMVKSLEGWSEELDSTSVAQYGRIEDSLDTGASQSMAKKLAGLVFSSRAQEEIGATYRVVTVKYKPYVDYFVGDWVLAPNERGVMVPRRIVSISYEESSAGQPVPTVEFDTIFQDNEAKLANAVGKLGGGGVGGSLGNSMGSTPGVGSPVELPPTSSPPTLKPKTPTGLTASSVGYWSANGVNTLSTVTLNWAAVTQYEDNSPLVVDHYEVERKLTTNTDGWEIIGKYYTNKAVIPAFTPGQGWDFRVSAVDNIGTVSQPSTSVSHTPVGPTTPMAAPVAPTLVSDLGIIVVSWSGKLAGNIEPPPQFRYVYAEMSTAATGQPWVRVGGSIQRGGGQIQITTEPKGAQRWVRLFAIDGAGIVSSASPSASITVQGIQGVDIDDAVMEAIEDAQSTADAAITAANGKNKLYFQTAMPAGTNYNVGDTWFDTDDGNKIYYWVSPGSWAPAALGTNAIADAAIVNAKIANLDAGKISTGTLDANRIGAKTITAEKLVIAATGNLLPNGNFTDGLAGWSGSLPVAADTVTDGPDSGTTNIARVTPTSSDQSIISTAYPGSATTGTAYEPGTSFAFRLRARVVSGTSGSIRIRLGFHGGGQGNQWPVVSGTQLNASSATPGQWVTLEGVYTTPVGNPRDRMSVSIHASGAAGSVFEVAEITMRPMASAKLIVDGDILTRHLAAEAITAEKIKAGTITVNELSPSIGSDLVLSSNSTITTIVNTQGDQANQIASVRDTANNANSTAQDAATTAGNAQNQVNSLDTKVDAVDAEQKGTKNAVNNLQTWFRVDAAGAHVGQTGSIFQTHILPDQFNITENDVVTTYWQAGQMVVPSLVADKMVLTNFTFEAYAGGMVVRLG